MIAVDTNILVYARRSELPHHRKARALLFALAEGEARWALPWPCAYEFLKTVTHPRIFRRPSSLEDAMEDLESLLDSPSLVMLGQGPSHRTHLRRVVLGGAAIGATVHDGHIAALALEHGVTELLTADRDFARFPGLRVRNPFGPNG
ncbi:MAG TPA: TA system VapC family ribonuclease toxin [Myxococcales bacterium]|nr:TA system VapC family ribonuclease toxin [Myxococcales bacterium]